MNQLEKEKKPQFLRNLNLLDSTSLVIGAVIGSGIFMTAGFIAEYLPSPGLILIVWLVGGLITISGALSFAELGALFPKAGGQYIYIYTGSVWVMGRVLFWLGIFLVHNVRRHSHFGRGFC